MHQNLTMPRYELTGFDMIWRVTVWSFHGGGKQIKPENRLE